VPHREGPLRRRPLERAAPADLHRSHPSSIAEVPPGFDAWFARATERDPDARFQTARELADALADILTPGQRWLDSLDENGAGAMGGRC
jgi:hypothetical protein